MKQVVPVILCGGSGTRLWPLSTKTKPKPFHKLTGDRTMLAETLARCSNMGAPIIVGAAAHEAFIKEDLPEAATLIVEPVAKNTAPAIGLAAAILPRDAVMLVCPSDAYMGNPDAFRAAAERAAELAGEGWMVAFGIKPTGAETGYGYLKQGRDLGRGAAEIDQFVEKPDLERAQMFLADGGYFWNGGIFVFTVGRYLDELAKFEPEMAVAVDLAAKLARREYGRLYPDLKTLETVVGNSIDYAVMERADRVAMVEADMGWSDIGNWEALRAVLSQDADGNVKRGQDVLMRCKDVLVVSDGPAVSAVGLEGVSIIVHQGEVVVVGQGEAQVVGLLSELRAATASLEA